MQSPLNDAGMFLIGLLVAAVIIGAIVAVLMKMNREQNRSGPTHTLEGGEDVSAALGVQQSSGLRIKTRQELEQEELKRHEREKAEGKRDVY